MTYHWDRITLRHSHKAMQDKRKLLFIAKLPNGFYLGGEYFNEDTTSKLIYAELIIGAGEKSKRQAQLPHVTFIPITREEILKVMEDHERKRAREEWERSQHAYDKMMQKKAEQQARRKKQQIMRARTAGMLCVVVDNESEAILRKDVMHSIDRLWDMKHTSACATAFQDGWLTMKKVHPK